jgi:hypothetical protein
VACLSFASHTSRVQRLVDDDDDDDDGYTLINYWSAQVF